MGIQYEIQMCGDVVADVGGASPTMMLAGSNGTPMHQQDVRHSHLPFSTEDFEGWINIFVFSSRLLAPVELGINYPLALINELLIPL